MAKRLKLTTEHKARIKENNAHYWLGKVSVNKGKKYSDDIRKKMSIGRSKFYKEGGVHPLKGKHRSLETRLKISLKLNKGLSAENHKIRNGIEHRLWRESVFARDNWTCQKTGIKGGELHPHHIKNFAKYPELRFAIDNGITLSAKSHREFHRIYGNVDNTEEQLIEFLNS
jgi:hypothetical protein